MSNDDDNLMSSADGGHVQESKDARKSRLTRDRQRKHRKLHPRTSRPVSALTSEELDRKRTQDRASQRRYSRKKKKQIAAAKIEAQRHAGNIETHNVDHAVSIGDNGSYNNEASINICAKHPESKAEDIRCVCKVVKANANGKGVFRKVPK
jgi:hypothetical protein